MAMFNSYVTNYQRVPGFFLQVDSSMPSFDSQKVKHALEVVNCFEESSISWFHQAKIWIIPNLVICYSLPWFFDGPNRNRWFTELKNGDCPWLC